MSQIIISDLSFCENTGANVQDLEGGSYLGTVSTSVNSDVSTSHSSYFNIQNLGYGYLVIASYSGATAGAVSAAISVAGTAYSSAYASTYTR